MGADALRMYRVNQVGMIFQDPRAHVNPVHTVEDFLTEGLVVNRGLKARDACAHVIGLLEEVGVDRPPERLRQHPYELSGGLLQRVMIAAVLAMEPRLILADEPTTALDVTTQSDVMSILDEARAERAMGLLLITHDLELAASVCDRTVVMYAGSVMEEQPSRDLHRAPGHPYTAALIESRPSLDRTDAHLRTIRGRPLSAVEAPPGCPFAPRCEFSQEACGEAPMIPRQVGGARTTCIRADELGPVLRNDDRGEPVSEASGAPQTSAAGK
jgi:oligopeptide/dipeptide ABC transporter ATP-binding protein